MGNFNPNQPIILGMEYVPLIDPLRTVDIFTEYGYSFTVTGAPFDAVDHAESIIVEPSSGIAGQTLFYSIYPRGREDDTGQIQVQRFPVSTAFITGATVQGGGTATTALNSSMDAEYIQFTALSDRLRVTIDNTGLAGKRILAVDLVYQAAGTPGFALEPSIESNTVRYPFGPFIVGPPTLQQVTDFGVVRFGDVNPWWSTAAGPDTQADRMCWRAVDMDRFGTSGAGGQLYIGVRPSTIPLGGSVRLGFLAVDVYFCEESRVAVGGRGYGDDPAGLLSFDEAPNGSGGVTMRNPLTFASPVTLAPGSYTVTTTMADAGDKYNAGDRIDIGQLYEYRGVSTHPTAQVEKFKRPSGIRPIIAPNSSTTPYMVGVVLRGNADALQFGEAPVTYVGMTGAPVYVDASGTSITAVQQIHNEARPADQVYEQVRFYARRFNPLAPGDLTVSVAGSGSAVLTPAAFNELADLNLTTSGATGWREVTLPISATFTSDATFRNVTFTMTGVSAGEAIDQWQVMVARTRLPQVSSTFTPGGYEKSRYDGLQNGTLTYVAPEAATLVPQVATNATAVVMFSQSTAAPTGLAVSQSTQRVGQIGIECITPPTCIPTGIAYNHVTWGANQVVCDSYTRTVAAGGWGTADTGQTWNITTGTALNFSVNGSQGVIAISSVNATHRSEIDGLLADVEVSATVQPGVVATGATISMGVIARRDSGADSEYRAEILFGLAGVATLRLIRRVAAADTTLSSFALPGYTAATAYNMVLRVVGSLIQGKAWRSTDVEPSFFQLSVADTGITAAGTVGTRSRLDPGNTNTLPVRVVYDNFSSAPIELVDATYEVQRMDDVDDLWQTVALVSPCRLSFDDYEARVGVLSTYRIRTCNISNFCGPWSTEVSTTLPTPGITGAQGGNSVLIFTSNQAPTGNLAYVMTWEGAVAEQFTFPEAGFVQRRTQYQRDFFTAFHGTERGGDAFSRQILVQNAAIAAPSLSDFRSLRNLGWANLPYVCVRDELGNRWYANVIVPDGTVRRNRRNYVANIDIVEVTSTPAPVIA